MAPMPKTRPETTAKVELDVRQSADGLRRLSRAFEIIIRAGERVANDDDVNTGSDEVLAEAPRHGG